MNKENLIIRNRNTIENKSNTEKFYSIDFYELKRDHFFKGRKRSSIKTHSSLSY